MPPKPRSEQAAKRKEQKLKKQKEEEKAKRDVVGSAAVSTTAAAAPPIPPPAPAAVPSAPSAGAGSGAGAAIPPEVTALVRAKGQLKATLTRCAAELQGITTGLEEQAKVQEVGREPDVLPYARRAEAVAIVGRDLLKDAFAHHAAVTEYTRIARESDAKHKGLLKRLHSEEEKKLPDNAQNLCQDCLKVVGDIFVVLAQVRAERRDESAFPLFEESIACFRRLYTAPECGPPMDRAQLLAGLTGDIGRIVPALQMAPGFVRALDALLLEAGAMVARSSARLYLAPEVPPKPVLDLAVTDLAGAVAIYRKLGDIPGAAQCLIKMAPLQAARGDALSCADCFKRAAELYVSVEDYAEATLCFVEQANVLQGIPGQAAAARDTVVRAISTAKQSPSPFAQGKAFFAVADVGEKTAAPVASDSLSPAASGTEKGKAVLPEAAKVAEAKQALAEATASLFTPEGCSSSLSAAALLFAEAQAPAEEASCYMRLGMATVNRILQRFDKTKGLPDADFPVVDEAKRKLTKAFELYRRLDAIEEQGMVLVFLGMASDFQSRQREAFDAYSAGVKLLEAAESPDALEMSERAQALLQRLKDLSFDAGSAGTGVTATAAAAAAAAGAGSEGADGEDEEDEDEDDGDDLPALETVAVPASSSALPPPPPIVPTRVSAPASSSLSMDDVVAMLGSMQFADDGDAPDSDDD